MLSAGVDLLQVCFTPAVIYVGCGFTRREIDYAECEARSAVRRADGSGAFESGTPASDKASAGTDFACPLPLPFPFPLPLVFSLAFPFTLCVAVGRPAIGRSLVGRSVVELPLVNCSASVEPRKASVEAMPPTIVCCTASKYPVPAKR